MGSVTLILAIDRRLLLCVGLLLLLLMHLIILYIFPVVAPFSQISFQYLFLSDLTILLSLDAHFYV